jgi:NADPH:quinone reductase-like Zn-dependent oxidoreductase
MSAAGKRSSFRAAQAASGISSFNSRKLRCRGVRHGLIQGFDVVYDTVGGPVLDASFNAVARFGHVVSALGWGTHALAPLSFRAASYSGVFTLLPMLTGVGREHHGEILREATRLAEAGKIVPRLDPRHFSLETVDQAHAAIETGTVAGKIVVDTGE